jgi:nicotinamide-nucleotide amidase
MLNAIVLSIGDELVLGQTVDTNSAWISQQLAAVGAGVAAHLTVSDDQRAIEQAILESVGRCDVLICSGGIGPTEDDLTRQALASVMGVELELSEQWLRKLEAFFHRINRPMSPLNRIQAMIPRGATMIDNPNGTAAGIDATYVSGDQKTICRIFVMPGVPKEMKAMFAASVLPVVRERAGGAVILSRTLHTFGLGESAIAEKLGPLMMRQRNPSVGTTVSGGIVSLRINSRFGSLDEATRELEATEAACRDALGPLIFGTDEETLPSVVHQLILSLPTPPLIRTAESCTGGLVAKMLTDTAGSSAYFDRSFVTYSNQAKQALLGVPAALIEQHGAVSEPVAKAMAEGARGTQANAVAIALSGIAGPGGGTRTKPVGTVCIALAHDGSTTIRTFVLTGDREMIRDRAAKMALTMLRFHLLGQPPPF